MGYLKEFGLEIVIIAVCLILFFTGLIFDLLPTAQVVFKKTFLVAWWYSLTYIFRKLRIGTLYWEDEFEKKAYYFVLLIGSALIFALA